MAHLVHPYPRLFESGDRMSREEFIARWEQMPELKNAELIDGVVYMPSPVSLTHGSFHVEFCLVLGLFAARTPGCKCSLKSTWFMLESAPQPDLALYILPEYGGRLKVVDGFASGAPRLAVEIVKSSRAYDLGPKLALYQRAEVLEYVAALIEEKRIEWRVLEDGSYRSMPPDSAGVFRSRVFPGLWFDSAAFWREDEPRLLAVLEEGLRSEEHARFVETLKRD
jgi:Putative restriction endonuclease